MLVFILDQDRVDANATDDFMVFVIANDLDDVPFLLTVTEDNFNSMGYDINFKTFRALQTLNKMYNKEITDTTSKLDENLWFLDWKRAT